MRFRDFLMSLSLCWTSVAFGQEFETTDHLKDVVKNHIKSIYLQRFTEQEFDTNVDVQISNIDARLRLQKCVTPIEPELTSPNAFAGSVTIKLSCTADNRWSIYVPATVNQYALVAVAAHSLGRGQLVTESDLEFVRMNLRSSGTGLIEDAERIIGKQLKRSLQAGNPIRLAHIKMPHVVKKGQKVSLRVSNSTLSVVTNGTAMGNGELGASIKVQNTHSKRIVDAVVVAPGVAEVQL